MGQRKPAESNAKLVPDSSAVFKSDRRESIAFDPDEGAIQLNRFLIEVATCLPHAGLRRHLQFSSDDAMSLWVAIVHGLQDARAWCIVFPACHCGGHLWSQRQGHVPQVM